MIKIVIAEDSPVVQEYLKYVLESDPDLQVVGMANDGHKAVEMVMRTKPDVVVMDIKMPKMNGFQATRRIMETAPVPIVLVSASYDTKEASTTFQAIEAGALTVMDKPVGIKDPDYEELAKEFIQTVKLMSEVKVVTRKPQFLRKEAVPAAPSRKMVLPTPAKIKLVAIGASTGGTLVLQTILLRLPGDFPVPLVIVQHIAEGFIQGLAEWLDQTTGFPVHVATHGENLSPGHAYLVPDDFHVGVSSNKQVSLNKAEKENGLRPSVSYLFRSVANEFGKNAVGVILTGMGADGAKELKLMKEKGAVTIAQDEKTSLIFGMPGRAVEMDAAQYVLPSDKIAEALVKVTNNESV